MAAPPPQALERVRELVQQFKQIIMGTAKQVKQNQEYLGGLFTWVLRKKSLTEHLLFHYHTSHVLVSFYHGRQVKNREEKKAMKSERLESLRSLLDEANFQKIERMNHPTVNYLLHKAINLCKPDSVFVATDDPEDAEYIRTKALETREESKLATPGHTVHFDGPRDQARDKENTRYLLPPDVHLGKHINYKERDEGLREVKEFLEKSMKGKEMVVCFYCLGPRNSIFSQLSCQVTDSFYVAHSENILYRPGYEDLCNADKETPVFCFLHSAGRLVDGVSADVDKRRIYIDLAENIVYSVNTQYGGNTMGLKKLAMRLGVSKSLREGWLTEHMFVIGVPRDGEAHYITGAFPSLCGKTSTAMLPGQTILGDDIAYLKKVNGEVRAVNVESGIFGIILDVNPVDDPAIFEALTKPGEVIFSNVLVKDGKPYWTGMGKEIPTSGYNFAGEWWQGKTGEGGKEIPPSHKNARYTIRLNELPNCDPHLDDPAGVKVEAIIFGGRDSDCWVPVEQSFDWTHGVITKGASLESETTAATLGKEGVRKFNPMSNLDFLAASLDTYINKYLDFAKDLSHPPVIFGVNYFLTDEEGKYLNGIMDKVVWLNWIVERICGRVGALPTPTGFMPLYRDLKRLFAEKLGLDYSEAQYKQQFTVRVPQQLAKIERIERIYRNEWGIPEVLFKTLEDQKTRLEEARKSLGDFISPLELSQRALEG